MKKTLAIFLILLFHASFLFFENHRTSEKRVIKVITPTVFQIDLNNNGSYDVGEKFCISNIKSFSTNVNSDTSNLEKILKLSRKDSLTIGYFADEFAKSTLLNKKVKLKNISKTDYDCQNAEIIINGISYQDLLKNSGFAIVNEKPVNQSKFEKILKKAKHTELVILNNSSIKSFFSLEEENILILEKFANISEKEKIEIKSLKRGECLMFVGDEHILNKIESADFEREIIENKWII